MREGEQGQELHHKGPCGAQTWRVLEGCKVWTWDQHHGALGTCYKCQFSGPLSPAERKLAERLNRPSCSKSWGISFTHSDCEELQDAGKGFYLRQPGDQIVLEALFCPANFPRCVFPLLREGRWYEGRAAG